MFMKHSKTSRWQKTIHVEYYKTNEQNTKYSYWNMQIEAKPGKVSGCSVYFYFKLALNYITQSWGN